jgi:hypothetical protein
LFVARRRTRHAAVAILRNAAARLGVFPPAHPRGYDPITQGEREAGLTHHPPNRNPNQKPTNQKPTKKTHQNSLWLNATLGLACVLAFSVLQRSFFPRHYRYRLLSNSVTIKPRALPTKGWSSLW